MIHAQGDGIDANGTLEITGGHTTVVTPTQGDTSTLDFDVSGVISGGFLVATGTTGMSQTPAGSGQGVISVRQSGQQAGTPITVTDSQGNVLLTHTPDMAYMLFTFSCPELVAGETYTVTFGSSQQPVTAN